MYLFSSIIFFITIFLEFRLQIFTTISQSMNNVRHLTSKYVYKILILQMCHKTVDFEAFLISQFWRNLCWVNRGWKIFGLKWRKLVKYAKHSETKILRKKNKYWVLKVVLNMGREGPWPPCVPPPPPPPRYTSAEYSLITSIWRYKISFVKSVCQS